MNKTAQYWIENLKLLPHEEGGSFNRYFLSKQIIPQSNLDGFSGDRHSASKTYYLLEEFQVSVFHKIKQQEIWDFLYGDPMELLLLSEDAGLQKILIGNVPDMGTKLSYIVEPGTWMAGHSVGDYSLLSCTCTPGFDYDDFTMADRETLSNQYPEFTEIINFFTNL